MSSSCNPKYQDTVSDGNTVVAISEPGQLLLNLQGTLLSTTGPSSQESWSKAARTQVARSLVAGLGYLHEVHIYLARDLSPSRVLLLSNGTVAVFIMARMTSSAKNDNVQEDKDWNKMAEILGYVWTSGNMTFIQQALLLKLKDKQSSGRSTNQIVLDPAFWTPGTVMDFLTSTSDVLELKQPLHRQAVEDQDDASVTGSSWIEKLHPVLQSSITRNKRRRYQGSSVSDLLRVIRNYSCHYYTIDPALRNALGAYDDLGEMWTGLFPSLLLHLHRAMERFKDATNCKRITKFYSQGT